MTRNDGGVDIILGIRHELTPWPAVMIPQDYPDGSRGKAVLEHQALETESLGEPVLVDRQVPSRNPG